jgi:hypothetical protein
MPLIFDINNRWTILDTIIDETTQESHRVLSVGISAILSGVLTQKGVFLIFRTYYQSMGIVKDVHNMI